jgi:hypothetical protein
LTQYAEIQEGLHLDTTTYFKPGQENSRSVDICFDKQMFLFYF